MSDPNQTESNRGEPLNSPDPLPEQTAGLEPGNGVAPGDTPPIESSTSGTSYHQTPSGRGYNTTALIIIAIIVVAVLAFIIGKIVAS
jgi:hypothetical protein